MLGALRQGCERRLEQPQPLTLDDLLLERRCIGGDIFQNLVAKAVGLDAGSRLAATQVIERQIASRPVQEGLDMLDWTRLDRLVRSHIGFLSQILGDLRIANDPHHAPGQGPAMQLKCVVQDCRHCGKRGGLEQARVSSIPRVGNS